MRVYLEGTFTRDSNKQHWFGFTITRTDNGEVSGRFSHSKRVKGDDPKKAIYDELVAMNRTLDFDEVWVNGRHVKMPA